MKHMKRLLILLLILLLFLQPLTGLATQAAKDSFAGTWYQTDSQGEAWEIELNADGTGTMRNTHQEIPLEWEAHVMAPDMAVEISIKADFGDGVMTDFDSFLFIDGVLESLDGRRFDRGKPDVVFLEPYPAAKFAPKSAFDGVWEMTGGILTVIEPPMTMELNMAELGLKPPVYIGIKNGRICTSNQGDSITADPSVISQYAGNAIYAGRVGLGITAVLYYVGPDTIHVKYAGPHDTSGADVTFTMYKTDLKSTPASDAAWENFLLDPYYSGPPQP
jgi:hypothetical protein